MWRVLRARFQQGHRTMRYPAAAPPSLPDRFRGPPIADTSKCPEGCRECVAACPTEAITAPAGELRLDLGRCLFCTDCVAACPTGALSHSHAYSLAVRRRDDLVIAPSAAAVKAIAAAEAALDAKLKKLFGRSLKLRQVSAGGCNGCEADTNVLGTVGWDIGRFGIQFVASPRHADGILITGAVSDNMRAALLKTWAAIPAPKIAIAVGACAISGGPYVAHPECHDGIGGLPSIPIDLHIPGCPPHPLTILDGLLRMLDRVAADPGRAPSATGTRVRQSRDPSADADNSG